MLGKIFSMIVTISFFFALISGQMDALSRSILDAAADAVTLSVSLLGLMSLWSGVIRVLDCAGVTRLLSRLLRPLLRLIYPTACREGKGEKEIAANMAANLLGLGNAALPLGLSAMEQLSSLSHTEKEKANPDMMTFAVMNTVPFQLMPTTLMALRGAAGAAAPYDILLPVWLCSLGTVTFAALLCRLCGALSRRAKEIFCREAVKSL